MKIFEFYRNALMGLFSLTVCGVASASCGPYICAITDFPGTADEQIEAAMIAAKNTTHKIVYFPDGVHNITRAIKFPDETIDLIFQGQSDTGAILNYVPTPVQIGSVSALPPVFDIDRIGGYTDVNLIIKRLTIDMTALRSHPYFLFPGPGTESKSAHAIRVGNGWDTGSLSIDNIRINNTGGYGIGIGTTGTDKNADNIILQNIHIENSGMDAIDVKHPNARLNRNFKIFDLYVSEIGQNDDGSAAGIDIRAEDFYVRGYTFNSQANVPVNGVTVATTGIVLRGLTNPLFSTRDGILRNLYITNGNRGISMDRSNADVVVKAALISGSAQVGVFIRDATDVELKNGCVWNTGAAPVFLSGTNINVVDNFAHYQSPHCPTVASVGSAYRKDF